MQQLDLDGIIRILGRMSLDHGAVVDSLQARIRELEAELAKLRGPAS